MSYPPPLPIAPLAYDMGTRRGRPALITAVGVMSIVVACVSALVCLWSGLTSASFLFASQRNFASLSPATPPPARKSDATLTIAGIAMDADDESEGLDKMRRQPAMTALQSKQAIEEPRLRQLEALLRVGGQKIFPSAAGGASAANLRANITESGDLPSGGRAPGPTYFIVGTGRIEVYDDHAVFRPDGSADVISISQPAQDAASDPGDAAPPAADPTARPPAVTLPPATTMRPVVGRRSPLKISTASGVTVLTESLLSFGLTIYLIVAGILVLRDNRSGNRLHWIYVAIKIPLVIVAAIGNWWMWDELMTSMRNAATAVSTTGRPAPNFQPAGLVLTCVILTTVLAIAYPIALLFVLRSRTVREYYASVREV